MDNCPIRKEAEKLKGLGGEMKRAMRRLRRDLARCDVCPDLVECPIRQEFNAMIDGIIAEVNKEWGRR